MKYTLFLLLLIPVSIITAQNSEKTITLLDLQKKYVGKTIIVKSSSYADNGMQKSWNKAIKKGIYYVSKYRYLPNSYINKKAKIIAIQPFWPKDKKKLGSKNAFGETIGPESIKEPYCEIVVKFDDGKTAISTAYPETTNRIFETIDEFKAGQNKDKEVSKLIQSIIGDTLYATSSARIFESTANVDDMVSNREIATSKDYPRLEPLTIVAAKSATTKPNLLTSSHIVLIKLKDNRGQVYLTFCDGSKIKKYYNYSVLQIVAKDVSMYVKIPSYFTDSEIQAIRNGRYFKGMSVLALYESIGYPDKTNENSYGGNQLIYYDSGLYIYLDDKNEYVEDWQIRE